MTKFPFSYIFSFICVLLLGCTNYTDNIICKTKRFKGVHVSLPLDKMELYVKEKTITHREDINKLVVFVDSTECSTCYTKKMETWYYLLDTLQNKNFEILVIFSPKKNDCSYIKSKLKYLKVDFPIYLDSIGAFVKNNPHIPDESIYHTFLLDKNNKVLLVGNPFNNKNVSNELSEIIEKTSISQKVSK